MEHRTAQTKNEILMCAVVKLMANMTRYYSNFTYISFYHFNSDDCPCYYARACVRACVRACDELPVKCGSVSGPPSKYLFRNSRHIVSIYLLSRYIELLSRQLGILK